MASSKSKRRRQPAEPQAGENPWDREAAEALTRAYEESEAEWRESRSARRPPHDRGRPRAAKQGESTGNTGLETRLVEIADRLQRSIAGIDPDKSAGALGSRIEELEQRLSAAFEDVARRLEGHNLEKIEEQISGLNAHLEHTRGQIERIDAIDTRLRELAERIDEHRRLPEASRLSDEAIEVLIQSAADRAADRVVQSLPPQAPGIDPERLDALEALMREQIAERRQTEEMTSSVLRTIEDALGRILDRVDILEPAGASGPRSHERYEGSSPLDPLLEAYAQGARALGQVTPASLLDAEDYSTGGSRTGSSAPDRSVEPSWSEQTDTPAREEPRPASAPGKPHPTEERSDDEPKGPAASARARGKPFSASGRLSGLLLMLAATGLFSAGYLAVDFFLAQSKITVSQDQTVRPSVPETTASIARVTPADKDPASASADERLVSYDGAKPSDTPGTLPEGLGTSDLGLAAAGGNPVAQFEVASRYAEGRGLAQSYSQALTWFQRAAMHGFAPAQFRLAHLLERGTGTDVDVERAKVWYRRAAEQGHVNAMHNLAVLLARRDGGAPDYATAAIWFREAAERGLSDSQYNLGVLCEMGLGVPKSLPEAYKWLALAARGGDTEAAGRLQQIKTRLGAGDIAAAEQQVADWRPRTAPVGPALGVDEAGAGG
jgi:TPR repeat protein